MTPVSAIPGHLRLLVLWARESFVQSLPHAQASIPPREAAAAHTGPAHSQRCQTSLWALCGGWKQSQLTLFSVSLYFPNSRNLWLKQHGGFFTDLHSANILHSLQGDGIAQATDQQESQFLLACREAPAPLLFVHVLWNLHIQHCSCQSYHENVHIIP